MQKNPRIPTPRCVPPLTELDLLPTPLNQGESRVLAILLSLDRTWTVFVQPRLALMQPDFVAVHPEHGVWIVEVKDWAPAAYRKADGGRLEVRSTGEGWAEVPHPMEQGRRYRELIFDRCFARQHEDFAAKARVRAIVVLPNHDDGAVASLLGSFDWVKSVGRTQLANLPALLEAPSAEPPPNAECLRRLHCVLGEPELAADQRLPLRKSAGAKNVATNPNGAKIRRVRGPAGSGKSIGVAARAIELAHQQKTVIVLSFNVTLIHYLQDLCAREARSRGLAGWRRKIDFNHFHGLCRDLYRLSPNRERRTPDSDGEWLVDAVTRLYRSGADELPTYDAILVDEGQDFQANWWALLRDHLLRAGGEMLLACDWSQNLYERRNWVDEPMSGGFSGPWTDLRGTYRMPVDLVPVLTEFAATHMTDRTLDLPTIQVDHPARGLACAPTDRTWENVPEDAVAGRVLLAVEAVRARHPTLHPYDIVVLADHQVGASVMEELERHGHDVAHLFAPEEGVYRDRLKRRFWAGSPGIKGSTFHSFKGWEARAVIPVLTDVKKAAAELYIAITRVKADPYHRAACISVVNAVRDLDNFQARFTRQLSVEEVPALAGQQSLTV